MLENERLVERSAVKKLRGAEGKVVKMDAGMRRSIESVRLRGRSGVTGRQEVRCVL